MRKVFDSRLKATGELTIGELNRNDVKIARGKSGNPEKRKY
jgi:hypothetical protein